ncbi:hypothetical protein BD779DRAFT_1064476 [Infundibulicybe gibba]|nr:hypothetical protein BD779DRAFT_1064476 [Infundibulicybe gibba]
MAELETLGCLHGMHATTAGQRHSSTTPSRQTSDPATLTLDRTFTSYSGIPTSSVPIQPATVTKPIPLSTLLITFMTEEPFIITPPTAALPVATGNPPSVMAGHNTTSLTCSQAYVTGTPTPPPPSAQPRQT